MAFPKPKPELSDEQWMNSVIARRCVHLCLDPSIWFVDYKMPMVSEPWRVCLECCDILNVRLLNPKKWNKLAKKSDDAGMLSYSKRVVAQPAAENKEEKFEAETA